MSVSRCYVATSDDGGTRLDALMGKRGLFASRSAAAHAIDAGKVLVGGAVASKKQLVKAGDAIVYEIEEESVETPLTGEPIPLDIRYEDDDIVVLSKQAGLVCHPSDDHRDGTLVNALIYRFGAANLCNVQGEADRLGIVHRLDMDTTGLMMAAKSDIAGDLLMRAIQDHDIDRHYLALVHGIITHDTGVIDAPITRHPKDRTRMAIRDTESARDAITTFSVLARFEAGLHDNGYSLLDCKLFTGRTHQIRVHTEYVKHPIVGDPLYTAHRPKHPASNLQLRRQFLHSFKLRLTHPLTGEELEFADNLPQDLAEALAGLQTRDHEETDAGVAVAHLLDGAPVPSIVGVPYLDQR